MTPKEIAEINWDWEKERARLMAGKRRAWAKAHADIALIIALFVVYVTFMYFWNKYTPERMERAYQEGVAAADARAAAVGGWDRYIELEVAKLSKEVR